MADMTPGRSPHSQRGAVLITGIIFMLVLTMLVLAMIRGGTFEERMARNARDQQRAMQSAEAVLRDAETYLVSGAPFDPFDSTKFDAACTGGLCYKPGADQQWDKIDWTSQTITRSFSEPESKLKAVPAGFEQPRYIIEILTLPTKTSSAAQCENGLAKITARGVGITGATVYVQSTVRFRVFTNICT
jgi:type IV pilus assembly protein PilX